MNITTILLSPDPQLFPTIKVGDKYSVHFFMPDGPLALITTRGDIIGSIIHQSNVRIIKCISEGYSFVGTIKDLVGGTCEIVIKNGVV